MKRHTHTHTHIHTEVLRAQGRREQMNDTGPRKRGITGEERETMSGHVLIDGGQLKHMQGI